MTKMGIYEIRNIASGKRYIGSSCNLKRRQREHINLLSRNEHYNNYLQNAWNKHGEDSFQFKVLEKVNDRDKLMDIEQDWLDSTKCYDMNSGYNIAKRSDTNLERLPEEVILMIAKLYRQGMHYKAISKATGVSIASVHVIKNGNLYSEITNLPKVEYRISELEDEEVLLIARTCKNATKRGINLSSIINRLSDKYNITNDIIYNISNGNTWSDVTGIKHIPTRVHVTDDELKLLYEDIVKGVDRSLISEKHNVTIPYISKVARGDIGSRVTGVKYKRQRLVESEVIEIYTRKSKGEKTKVLAEDFKVSRPTIERIWNKKIWKDITSCL